MSSFRSAKAARGLGKYSTVKRSARNVPEAMAAGKIAVGGGDEVNRGPVGSCGSLPENVSPEQGACLGMPGITAHRTVHAGGPVAERSRRCWRKALETLSECARSTWPGALAAMADPKYPFGWAIRTSQDGSLAGFLETKCPNSSVQLVQSSFRPILGSASSACDLGRQSTLPSALQPG